MILTCICARAGSKGVPGKNLGVVGGKTLVAWAVEAARAAPSVGRILCSTDSPDIADLARELEVDVPELRPDRLSAGDTSKWEVFRYVLDLAERYYGERAEFLIDLDLGTPFRRSSDIERCVEVLREPGVEVVTTGYACERNPYFNMAELDSDGFARLVKRTRMPFTSRQQAPLVYSLSPIVWGMTRDFLLRSVHWTAGRMKIIEVPRLRALDIDEPIDMEFAEFLARRGIWDRE